jgi:glycosyltransferase involved in cell wall biosynthesis
MRKIALVINWRYYPVHCDGGSLCMFEIARWFYDEGFPVEIFAFVGTPPPTGPGRSYLDTVEGRIGIRPTVIPNNRNESGPIIEILKKNRPDYVLTCDGDFVSLLAVATLSLPGLHLFNSPDNIDLYENNPLLKPLVRSREVCVLSRFLQNQVKTVFGIDALIWPPFIHGPLQDSETRFPRTSMSVGFYSAGKFKGDDIVRNVIHLAPEARFLIVGGDYSYLNTHHPDNAVSLGEVADMGEFFRSIDLLLVPSVWGEAFARVIVEAAFHGVPSIANRIGGIPEALGDSGILVDIDLATYDPAEVAETYAKLIRKISGDPVLYSCLSRQALERAHTYLREQRDMQKRFLATRFPSDHTGQRNDKTNNKN